MSQWHKGTFMTSAIFLCSAEKTMLFQDAMVTLAVKSCKSATSVQLTMLFQDTTMVPFAVKFCKSATS
uniref:Secreted protein n=1 Tax=Setaria viridis TaxID=4556 RepID=A0A4U6VVA6_SETVI|nr:hypothetical protein SEVIR_2G202850v2 [Setaria viridis]